MIYMNDGCKIIPCTIHTGGSIGLHRHETSDDIYYIISGSAKTICDGVEEELLLRCYYFYKKGSEHSIINTGDEDLVLLTIVVVK